MRHNFVYISKKLCRATQFQNLLRTVIYYDMKLDRMRRNFCDAISATQLGFPARLLS